MEGQAIPCDQILQRLNHVLVEGVTVLSVYEDGAKIKNLAYLDCSVTLEYDNGISDRDTLQIEKLFYSPQILVEKKGKNGIQEQDIAPMIRRLTVKKTDSHTLVLEARICCQNPTLNPAQLSVAVAKYLPDLAPSFTKCARLEIYDTNEISFR